MPEPQQQAWEALFELHERMPVHWVLVGGQNVYLHAVERGAYLVRPTTDADMGLDLRGRPLILAEFTQLLLDMGFVSVGETTTRHQHRWTRGSAIFDVLIPRGTGERSARRPGATGGTTLEAPGIQSAINRAETVQVEAGGVRGNVNRADIRGALIGKAAAMRILDDPNSDRHLTDAMTLLSAMSARELRRTDYQPAEKAHLALLLSQLTAKKYAVDQFDAGRDHLERLRMIAKDWSTADPNARLI
ncbi:hypothetical protein ACT3TS_17020 [Specibacter sp. AOP5-B1-6]|uniref:hypothetical protein n=1 Tax=Specibacter sp. AOP5-B1-6 TaxID=3457653 RepID=UPI00402B89CD